MLEFYVELGAENLVELSHRERPWIEARRGLGPTDRGQTPIELETMREYLGRLAATCSGKTISDAVKAGVFAALRAPEGELDLDRGEWLRGDDAHRWLDSLCPPES